MPSKSSQTNSIQTNSTVAVTRATRFRPWPMASTTVLRHWDNRRIDQRCLGVAVIDHDGVQVRVAVGPGPLVLTVGRHGACDLPLQQADASLRHVAVCADDDGVVIVDLGASFGVGDRRCGPGGAIAVRCGDSIVVATVVDAGERFADRADAVDVAVDAVDGGVGRGLRLVPRVDLARLPSIRALAPLGAPLPAPLSRAAPSALTGRRPDRWRPPPSAHADTVPLAGMRLRVLVGREGRNDVVMTDMTVSRVHAAIIPVCWLGRRQAIVVDAGSTNGTSVFFVQAQRQRISEVALGPAHRFHVVHDGDLIGLGCSIRLRVVDDIDDIDDIGDIADIDDDATIAVHSRSGRIQ
jgi:hypothetical protein